MNSSKSGVVFVGGLVLGSAVTALLCILRSRKSRGPKLRSIEDAMAPIIGAEDGDDFQAAGHYLLKWLVHYRNVTTRDQPVISTVAPNYLADVLPLQAPQVEEFWPDIFKDLDSAIVPGLTNW